MRKFHIGLVAAAGAAMFSFAAVNAQGGEAPSASMNPADVSGGTYAADPGHTQVLFSYKHFGLTNNMGLLSGATGTLTIDPKAPENAKLSVDVPINTLHSTISALDVEFQGKGFFEADTFPTAHFESTGVAVTGNTAKISGNLTIHGVTKQTEIDAKFEAVGQNPSARRKTSASAAPPRFSRSDFGLGMGVPNVGDAVELKITAAFAKQ